MAALQYHGAFLIWNAVHENLVSSIVYFEATKDAWENLECFSHGKAAQSYHIKPNISIRVQDQFLVASYFTTLKAYWDEINDLLWCKERVGLYLLRWMGVLATPFQIFRARYSSWSLYL